MFIPSPSAVMSVRLITPVLSFQLSSFSSFGVVIVISLFSLSQSTFSPRSSDTARTGIIVLPLIICGAVCAVIVSSFFVISCDPIVIVTVFDFFLAVTVCVSLSHLTYAPKASNIALIGTSAVSSTISGAVFIVSSLPS